MKRFLFLLTALIATIVSVTAQELRFKSFECRTTDIKAKVNQRNDINGNPCALIRVCMAAKNPTIRGNMGNVGEVTSPNPSEYEVYVPAGTRRIRISHPDYLPFTYEFSMKIEGLMTYELYIIVPEAGPTKPEIKTQYLALQVTPSDAMVLIDGMPQQVENGSLVAKFELGSHSYHIMAPQYHAIEGVFELNSEKRTDLKLDLKPRFGYLDIKSTPEGASVLVDGEVRGKTPCRIKLGSGEHFLQLMSDGYIAYGQNLTMSDGATIPLTMALKANFAQITLKAPYEHSEIWVNDKMMGKGSWTGRLDANTYLVETRTEGYENASENIEVVAEVSRTYTLQTPRPIYGMVEILSSPFNATIKLDGKEVGTTPWQSNEVLVGNHTLEVSKEGYDTHSESFTITRNTPKSINLSLKKQTAGTASSGSGTTSAGAPVVEKAITYDDLFPVLGVSLGKTTREDVRLMGYKSKKSVSGAYTCEICTGISLLTNSTGGNVFETMFIRAHGGNSAIPESWRKLGLNFSLNEEQAVRLFLQLGCQVKWMTKDYRPYIKALTSDGKVFFGVEFYVGKISMVEVEAFIVGREFYFDYEWNTTGDKGSEKQLPGVADPTAATTTPAASGSTTATESVAEKTYKVGDYYNENGKKGVVFWVDGTGQHGKIVHMYEDFVSLTWFNYNSSSLVELGTDKYDGEVNMSLVKSNNMKSRYSAFSWCEKSGAGWYLPAIGELEDLALDSSVLSAVNATLKEKGGEALTARKYVSSSESGKYSFWYLQMAGSSRRANQASKSVKSDYVVRPVAKF